VSRYAIAVALLVAAPARADVAAADAAFEEGKRLIAAGDLAAACPKLALSYREDPQLGTLLHLAGCHEALGQIATAWAEFRSAAQLAHDRNDKREAVARAHADQLEPRVSRVVVHRPNGAPTELVVMLDGRDITAMVDSPVPLNPGSHAIASTLAGRASEPQTV